MEDPDGRREALQKIERPSPLERGLRGHGIQGRKTSVIRGRKSRRLNPIYTPIDKDSVNSNNCLKKAPYEELKLKD